MAIKCPAFGMDISMASAILGRMPMITNSVRPIPKPPMARESNAFLFVGMAVFNVNGFFLELKQATKVVVRKCITYIEICQYRSYFHIVPVFPLGTWPICGPRAPVLRLILKSCILVPSKEIHVIQENKICH